MFENEIKHHDMLFSGSSCEIGKVHWYIQRADTEMKRKSFVNGKDLFEQLELTDFGKEATTDEISWWVSENEAEHEELLERTKNTLAHVQKLKEDSSILKEKFHPESYPDLIAKIKEFTESHKEEIHHLHDYVAWLHNKDVLAPCILFTYRVWGSTELSERRVTITTNDIEMDQKKVNSCTEHALGLRTGFRYTLEDVYLSILSDIAETVDSEFRGAISVPKKTLFVHASRNILDKFARYFELIRQSLRNVNLEIGEYNIPMKLLWRESFWKSFVKKAMVLESESQLWDFKETLEIWHDKGEKTKVKFCEHIAAIANTNGGILIVGITDQIPRKIVGIDDLENKLKTVKSVIKQHVNCGNDFLHFQQTRMKDDGDNEKTCLIIAIAQTKGMVSVKDKSGKFSYPVRYETGLERINPENLEVVKRNVPKDNYNFISNLYDFLHSEG